MRSLAAGDVGYAVKPSKNFALSASGESVWPSPALKGGLERLGVPHSSVLPSEQTKTAAMVNG